MDPEVIAVEPYLDTDQLSKLNKSSAIPLCLIMNCRSAFNKAGSLNEMMRQVCPDVILALETWERPSQTLNNIIHNRKFKYVSNYRKRKPGGGCAIIYNESRFYASDPEILVPENIEAIWSIFTPVAKKKEQEKVKRIAIASIYVSPRSKYKSETIDHIIETIHVLRAKHDNEINFLIGGDFNRLDVSDILESYGGLRQLITVPTRKSATLEFALTDLHTFFHPPTTIAPLEVDPDKIGKDSDHKIVVLAPKSNAFYKIDKKTRVIKTRPLLESQMRKFENDIANYPWPQMFENKTPDEQANIFHEFLTTKLDNYLPEKSTKVSNLDRKWFSPALKQLHRKMQREFFLHRKSIKFKKLKTKFKKMKRHAIKTFYSDFVSNLKQSDPRKWYAMAKKIGAVDQMTGGDIEIESLAEIDNGQAAGKIAEHFARISSQYDPIDYAQLPCYLPAPPPP